MVTLWPPRCRGAPTAKGAERPGLAHAPTVVAGPSESYRTRLTWPTSSSRPTSAVTRASTSSGGAPSATRVATRRNAPCSSAIRIPCPVAMRASAPAAAPPPPHQAHSCAQGALTLASRARASAERDARDGGSARRDRRQPTATTTACDRSTACRAANEVSRQVHASTDESAVQVLPAWRLPATVARQPAGKGRASWPHPPVVAGGDARWGRCGRPLIARVEAASGAGSCQRNRSLRPSRRSSPSVTRQEAVMTSPVAPGTRPSASRPRRPMQPAHPTGEHLAAAPRRPGRRLPAS